MKKLKYTEDWKINFPQCDISSRLKITEISNIFQIIANNHAHLLEMDYRQMSAYNQAWVLSAMRIELEKLPTWNQAISNHTWIQEYTDGRAIRNFVQKHNDKPFANLSSLWVVINTEKRRPEPLAVDISGIEFFPHEKVTQSPIQRLNIQLEAQEIQQRKVLYSDLDVVGHVNNIKYMEWCLDLLPIDFHLKKKIKAIDLNYLRELNFGAEVTIYQTQQEDGIYFYIKKAETIVFAMRVEER